MSRKFNLLALLTVITITSIAQSGRVIRADRNFDNFNFTRAAKLYKKDLELNPTNTAVKAKIADCYRLVNDMENAEKWYAEAIKIPNADPMNTYYYAQALRANEKYLEAKDAFTQFSKMKPDHKRAKELSDVSNLVPLIGKDNPSVEVQLAMGLNSGALDYSPTVYDNGIVFISNRGKDVFVRRNDVWTGGRFFDIFYAPKNSDGSFGEVEKFKSNTPNKKYHEGSVAFANSSNEMYFTRSNYNPTVQRASDNTVKLKIFKAVYNAVYDKWENFQELPFNSNEYNVAHPSLSMDGSQLYFVSDMPGGYGSTDVYVSYKQGNSWGPAVNLGPEVNSPGREMFPYLATDGTLYYASDGRIGLGGLDMYTAEKAKDKWGSISNLGAPYNSSDDDFGIVFNEDAISGYFTSNRPGGLGGDDIYEFNKQGLLLSGYVYDAETNERLDCANVSLNVGSTALNSKKVDNKGNFRFNIEQGNNYSINAVCEGYNAGSVTVSTTGDPKNMFVKIPLRQTGGIDLCVNVSEKNQGRLNGVQIDLRNNATGTLATKYTEGNGENCFNLEPETDYTIEVSAETGDPNRSYSSDTRSISTKGVKSPASLVEPFVLQYFEVGQVVEIPDIYYDLDKFYIRPDAAARLDQDVLPVMNKFPDMIIELRSHTDSRGSDAYNMKLSQNRAKSAVEYLVKRGISSTRMQAMGYGETQLKNGCSNGVKCSSEEHQQNRRTEFKILKLN